MYLSFSKGTLAAMWGRAPGGDHGHSNRSLSFPHYKMVTGWKVAKVVAGSEDSECVFKIKVFWNFLQSRYGERQKGSQDLA